MATKKELLERKHFVSDRLSTQVRTISVGTLAVSWGILIGESKTAQDMAGALRVPLMLVGAISILALLFDFLQYAAGYSDVSAVVRKMEKAGEQEAGFDP